MFYTSSEEATALSLFDPDAFERGMDGWEMVGTVYKSPGKAGVFGKYGTCVQPYERYMDCEEARTQDPSQVFICLRSSIAETSFPLPT